jgi:hypothetical protein
MALVKSKVTQTEDMLLAPAALHCPPHCRLNYLSRWNCTGDVMLPQGLAEALNLKIPDETMR